MEIKLDAETAASIASAAIFDSMSQDARDTVLKQAVQALLTPDKGSYSSPGKTPLQKAFEQAIEAAAFKAVREKIETDLEVQEAITKLLGPLLVSAMNAESENYNSSISEAIGKALGLWLAERARLDRR